MLSISKDKKLNITVIKVLALSFLIIVTVVLCFFIVYNANWLLGDDSNFFNTTAIGKYYPMSTWIGWRGRFPPLVHWAYNVLIIIPGGESPSAHYTLLSVGFLFLTISSYFFYKSLIYSVYKSINYNDWLIVFCIVFLLTIIYPVFLHAYMAENITTVLIAVFLLLYLNFDKTNKWHYGVFAFGIAVYLTYVKEPMFGAFMVISLLNLIFNYQGLTKKSKVFHYALILNSFVFISLYYFLVFRNATYFYQPIDHLNGINLFLKVFRSHKFLLLAFLVAGIRLFYILIRKDKQHLFYDGLLFAGISYTIAIMILKLYWNQYFFPAVVLCLPAIIFWSVKISNVKLVTIIMFICAFYCSTLIIDYIKGNQKARIDTYPQINSIAKLVSEGYTMLWFQPNFSANDNYNVINLDRKGYLEIYLEFILKSPQNIDFNIISSFDEVIIGNKTVILYPSENGLSEEINEKFENNIELNRFTLYNNIGGVKIFKN